MPIIVEIINNATVLGGRFQRVTLGATSKVLGAGNYTISGLARTAVDASEFGVDIDIFEFASAEGGTISLADVVYDPTDPQQNTLRNCVENEVKLIHSVTSGIRFWVNSTSYLTVGTSGRILLTRAGEVRADRNGLARTSFEGQISGSLQLI